MPMRGKLKTLYRDFDGSYIFSVAVTADIRDLFDELKDLFVSIEIKPWRKGRSLEANAFAWSLIGKIAGKLQDMDPKSGWTPEKVYLDAIRDVGGVYTIVGMKTEAVETFRQSWTAQHLGRMVEIIDGSTKEGWSNVRIYYGSSDYDTAQMSRLINILIQQAESLGIPTLTDKDVERMLGNYQKAEERRNKHGRREADQEAG